MLRIFDILTIPQGSIFFRSCQEVASYAPQKAHNKMATGFEIGAKKLLLRSALGRKKATPFFISYKGGKVVFSRLKTAPKGGKRAPKGAKWAEMAMGV